MDDIEIMVNRVDHGYMSDAVTLLVLRHYTNENPVFAKVGQDVQKRSVRMVLTDTKYSVATPAQIRT